ncbi:hypothetical protein [Acidicapsa ligni]|uniref:hypothetical protein n=1 Tax=Acidicapsa ligni TaxID=542300 RepID=UPI0021E004CA|nr:hypothetical protein [Acidicapsa ligni]
MKKWFFSAVFVGGISLIPRAAFAQQLDLIAPDPSTHKSHKVADKPALKPDISIATAPLGFGPPAPFYISMRIAQLSLDFLDEDTLLFTFHVPGLVVRERPIPSPSPSSSSDTHSQSDTQDAQQDQPLWNERHIRAVVLSLPDGRVTAEALWTVHDRARYLWMLKDRHFLLRDKNTVHRGDAALRLDPFLRFPGPVNDIELDPAQHLLVANTSEAPAPEASTEARPDKGIFPATASANVTLEEHHDTATSQSLLRILSMDSRSVMLFSRVSGTIHLPLDGEGYYEALRGNGRYWTIVRQNLGGSTVPLTEVESICSPTLDAVAPDVVLISACLDGGVRRLSVVSKDKALPWDQTLPPTWVWPTLANAPGARRIARATLDVTHPIGPSNPLDYDDIRGQIVQVYDLATGNLKLTVPANPALDGGGNFALSPSGNRLAVLNAGAIQIYNLTPAPAMP